MNRRGGGGVVSRSSVKMVFSRSTESFRRGTFLCFRKFRVSKNIMPMKGISRFSIENFSSHSTKKFCNGTLLPFTNILVTRKIMNKRGGGVVSRFSVKIVFSYSTE